MSEIPTIEVTCPYCGKPRSTESRDICCRAWGRAVQSLNVRNTRQREMVVMTKLAELEADLASRRRPGRPKKAQLEPIAAEG